MSKKIMLIDGNSIINRGFYALPLLTNKEGVFTNAVYGFLNIFFKLYDEEQPDYLAVAFDLPKPTFRHLQYAEYKGNRKSMPDELRPQIATLKNLLIKMNVKIFEMEGFEADDVLGTLAVNGERFGLDVVVISGDRDLLQLSTKTVKIRIPKTKGGKTQVEDYHEQDVLEQIGVTPIEYIDVKALMGDASDNIPGVPGIGEKTAVKIIQEYKSIEAAIENAANVKPKKASENLIAFKEQALMSKELATIKIDVPLTLQLDEVKTEDIYNTQALEEIKRLEFKTLIPRFLSHVIEGQDNDIDKGQQENKNAQAGKEIVLPEEAKALIHTLCAEKMAAFNLVFVGDEAMGISFSTGQEFTAFMKISDKMDTSCMLGACRPFFESNVKKITLDSKRELVYLQRLGYTVKNVCFDCMLAAYIIDSSKSSYFYDDIAQSFLNETYPTTDMVL